MKQEDLELLMSIILKYSKTIGDLKKVQKCIDKKIEDIEEYWNNEKERV